MKKIFRNLKFGLLLCAGAFAASCSDVEDAMDEIPYTRVLTPLNFEADVDAAVGTDIKFSWSAVSNADAYLLELFEAVPTITTDDKGNEVEVYEMPEYFDSANAYKTIEVAKDAVPYTVKDLAVDKTFWARVQGVNAKIESSNWACLAEAVSTSAVRKALNPQAKERTSTSVTLSWDNADDKEDLTSIRYELVVPVEGVTATTLALSKEQIEDCEAKIDELEPGTNYKFTLLFGKSGSRGILTAYTRPSTEGTQVIKNSGELVNAISSADGDLELLLEYNNGELYDLSSLMTLNATENIYDPFAFSHSLAIYGESTAEGAKPVIKLAIKPTAGCNSLHFEDVSIDGGNQCGVFVTTGGSIDGDAEFVNCEITGFTKGIWSGATDCNVTGTLLYENVYAHDINPVGAGAGDFIDIRGGDYGNIIIKNSTFYACARTFLRISETATKQIGSINVSNCTFNQVTATNTSNNNSGIFHIRYSAISKPDSYLQLGSFIMSKCVFLNMNNANETENAFWVRLTRDSNENIAPKCEGNIYYNIGHLYEGKNGDQNTFFPTKSYLEDKLFTEKMALEEGGMILADDPCTNSIAGKMYLKNGTIAANKAGDPRWWNASAPVIVRPTELETVTEATTWDFTDKTKFDTETIESNQIIENIRIYAPAEVVMSEGITFGAAATVSTKGVPLTSALAFNAEGYGSIEVTAQGTGITSTVQIIAGGDAYSVNADGKSHKVVLGDLVGANDIYVLPSVPNITFTEIAWTKDTTPEVVTEQLATPIVTLSQASIITGTQQAVSASWAQVNHAASYEVKFLLKDSTQPIKTETVEELSFELSSQVIAALDPGIYYFEVIAKPVSTSTKYEASKASSSMFAIGEERTIIWDFADSSFDDVAAIIGTDNNTAVNTEFNGLHFLSAGSNMKIENQTEGRRLRTGGGSSLTGRRIWFIAPGAGILTINATNPSSSATDGDETTQPTQLKITANVGGDIEYDETTNKATVTEKGIDVGSNNLVGKGYKDVSINVAAEENDIVNIVTAGGLRIASIQYTYFDTTKNN